MDAATETRRERLLSAGLAGLQAGMLGVFWMLLWLGIAAVWVRRSFWIPENLMASAFYGSASIHSGFASQTLSGLALYLLLYSLLGAIFALVVRDHLPPTRVMLVSLVFALSWYYFSFGVIWKSHLPLMVLLHSAKPTAVGHLIFGAVLGRYPAYLPKPPAPDVDTPPSPEGVETPPEEAPVPDPAQSSGPELP